MIKRIGRGVLDRPVKPGDDNCCWCGAVHHIIVVPACEPGSNLSLHGVVFDIFVLALPCTPKGRYVAAVRFNHWRLWLMGPGSEAGTTSY